MIKPEHLFDQARNLLGNAKRRPRQADLRRAVSSTYYAIFHALLIRLCDLHIGAIERKSVRYALLYRSIDHASVRRRCESLQSDFKSNQLDAPSANLGRFALTVRNLLSQRYLADYDPSLRFNRSEVADLIASAERAIELFDDTSVDERNFFLTSLITKSR